MKKINATKGDFVNIINGLFAVQDLPGKDFGLVVSKNITILKESLKDLEDAGKPSDEFMALAEKVNAIANENTEDSKDRIQKLQEENEELVKTRKDQMDALTKVMEEKIEVEIHMIEEDVLPNSVTAKQINQLEKIIE
mgnify:CR=1 FL=1|tara:strand:- start:436 stop:849 length:414 start_codon:yes stop_codon:yes gene_type:complete